MDYFDWESRSWFFYSATPCSEVCLVVENGKLQTSCQEKELLFSPRAESPTRTKSSDDSKLLILLIMFNFPNAK